MSKGIRLSEKHGLNPMMVQCTVCGGDTGEIALLGRLPGDAEALRKAAMPGSTCDQCKGWAKMGIIVVVVRDGSQADPYRTGELHVIKEEAAQELFVNIGSHRAVYLDESVARKMGFPKVERV